MPLMFEQQPKETDKAFEAFSIYLGMGPERSLTETAKRVGKSRRLLEMWSGKWNWAARVQAHGAHLVTVEREAAEVLARTRGMDWLKRQEEQREEEWRVRCELLELGRETIKRWKENPRKCGTLEGISRLLELASKLGRLASGMATDKTEVTGESGGPVRIEVTAALDRIYGRPLPGEVVADGRREAPAVVDVEAEPASAALPERTA